MHVTEAQRIRIALAFIALRHKPKDTSLAAYVLDLRDQFSLPKERKATPSGPWRERALKLESEVEKLKRKHADDLAELDALRANVRAGDNASPLTPQSPPSKKRKKLNAAAESHDGAVISAALLLQSSRGGFTSLGGLEAETAGPELSSALRLFNSYHKLFQLSSTVLSHPSQSINPGHLLFSATDVLRALARALQTTLNPHRSPKVSPVFLSDFNSILCSTLSRVMSVLPSTGAKPSKKPSGFASTVYDLESLNSFFTILACDVVIPFVKAFSRLSEDALLPILRKTRQQKGEGYSDAYGTSKPASKATLHGLLTILRGIIAIVGKSASASAQGLKLLDLIKLSTVTEIERLWPSSDGELSDANGFSFSTTTMTQSVDPCVQPVTKLRRQERVRRLGRKAALWYLCAIAHDVFSPITTRRSEAPTSDVIHDKLDVVLSRLVVRCSSPAYAVSRLDSRGTATICDIEKGMIVSVIENIWLAE